MAPELSSNWKKLQATLQQEAASKARSKRKAVLNERQKNSIAKRRRLEETSMNGNDTGRSRLASKSMGNQSSTEKTAYDEAASSENKPSASLVLWAEDNDISAKDLAEAYGGGLQDTTIKNILPDKINEGLATDVDIGKYIGIDCEMVGVGGEEDRSVLARVSIVNFHGAQVYDSFVRPKEFVTDWRTHVSGVSARNMATARELEVVQRDIAALMEGRIIVGHAIKNDLAVMMLGHPKRDIRDTSRFSGFRRYSAGKTPSLRKLAKEILGIDIQAGEHSSIEDARATMLLFRRHKSSFDVEHAKHYPKSASGTSKSSSKVHRKRRGNR